MINNVYGVYRNNCFLPTQAAGMGFDIFLLPGSVTDSVLSDRLICGFSQPLASHMCGYGEEVTFPDMAEGKNYAGGAHLGDLLKLMCAINVRMDVWLRGVWPWVCTWVPAAPTAGCCTLNRPPTLVQPSAGEVASPSQDQGPHPTIEIIRLLACFPKHDISHR